MVKSDSFHLETAGQTDILDITDKVSGCVRTSKIAAGLVNISVPGSTAGLTTIGYESGIIEDIKRAFETIAPGNIEYRHDLRWGDGNGYSHVRAALLGPSLSLPISGGKIILGRWQQIVLIDFDNRPRKREIIVQMVGD
ncbi:MAG: secondary thiamine-phosphate synthase enzyme YjbQ [Nitrospinota bacterium]